MSEFRRGLGYKRDKKDTRDYKMKVSRAEIEALPPAVILNDVTPVEDQGSLGSCTGNAGDNVFKLRDSIVMNHFFNGSRLALYYWAREIDGDVNDDAGSELRTMAQVLANKGVPPETGWPYIISRFAIKPPSNVDAEAKKSTATKYYRVDGSTPQETLTNIKAAISTAYPVMFGFDVYTSFMNTGSEGTMPAPAGKLEGGHAVTVIGYDDNHKNSWCGDGALFIKNSWGLTWGTANAHNPAGYFWMPYNYVLTENDHVGDAWEIIDESDFIIPPTPTPVGGTEMIINAVRGTDDKLWYQIRSKGVWSKWASLEGIVTSDPDVQKDDETGEYCVTVRGEDAASWHIYYKDGKWSDWESSGGQIKENGDLIIVDGVPS
jgi:Papain family cysteine protease